MSGAETARRRVVQRRIGGAEMALPRFLYPNIIWSVHKNVRSLNTKFCSDYFEQIKEGQREQFWYIK